MIPGLRAVAFDLGGVLVDVDHARAAASLGISLAAWEAALFSDDLHDKVSRGVVDASALFVAAGDRLGVAPAAARSAWASVVRVWPGAPALVDAVAAQGLRVLVWSNTDPVHAHEMAQVLPVIAGARGLSFRVGAMKPETAYYERALDPDLSFGEVLFLDDRADNVAAAAAVGVRAQHITGGIDDTSARLREALGLVTR